MLSNLSCFYSEPQAFPHLICDNIYGRINWKKTISFHPTCRKHPDICRNTPGSLRIYLHVSVQGSPRQTGIKCRCTLSWNHKKDRQLINPYNLETEESQEIVDYCSRSILLYSSLQLYENYTEYRIKDLFVWTRSNINFEVEI